MLKVMQRLFGGVVNEQNYGEFMKELGKRFIPKADYNDKLAELKELRALAEEQRVNAEAVAAAEQAAAEAGSRAADLQQALTVAECENEQNMKRLQLERLAELALLRAGAKNLTAAGALLDLRGLPEDGAEAELALAERVSALKGAAETAFLFSEERRPGAAEWQGFSPQEAGDLLDGGYAGGFRLRLARAHDDADCLSAIKVKQEAAAQGVILS